jgi:epoxyqueuosine reductase
MEMKEHSTIHTRTKELRNTLIDAGACLVGFADLTCLDTTVTRGYSFGICFALHYDVEAVDSLPDDKPFLKMSATLNEKTKTLYAIIATYLEDLGYHYARISSSIPADELPDLREELPQKTIATLAGLGWIGKSTLLISADYGPRIRLGVMLTDAPFKVNNPVVNSNCNDCNSCVDACPVSALTGLNWSQGSKRAKLLDVRICNSHLLEGLKSIGRKHICGLCLKACPIGRQ